MKRRIEAAFGWVAALGIFWALGLLFGHDVTNLVDDLFPLIFGGVATLVIDATMEEGEKTE